MVKDVWPYLLVGILLTIGLAWAAPVGFAVAAGIVTLCIAAFFRDPARVVPVDSFHILSQADGRVVAIGAAGREGQVTFPRVSIFLSVFNVHVNRAPVTGRVTRVHYTPGSFLPAFRDKASEYNEQNLIDMDTDRGPLSVKQIAGAVARRIRCWKKPGDSVQQGEKIGFITFGSRVDLFIPPEAELRTSVGDRVRAGQSVIAVYRQRGGLS